MKEIRSREVTKSPEAASGSKFQSRFDKIKIRQNKKVIMFNSQSAIKGLKQQSKEK